MAIPRLHCGSWSIGSKLEEYWNVSFDILITEREPLELLHAYYAQMYHILSNVSGLSTFKDYIQAGVSNEPSKDLGFRYLKPGVVTKAFVDGFGAERVFTIPMKELFEPGCVRLGLWHPFLKRCAHRITRAREQPFRGEGYQDHPPKAHLGEEEAVQAPSFPVGGQEHVHGPARNA
ncbi:MAG: hypothetical protein IPI81_02880 [Flavobacteriales bacterium]|nr:hypothetical protein [Flavobacteriales bacterium]